VARRLPATDDDHRVELAESVAITVADRPRCDRAWETASLVGLGLRLWGRREGGDDARLALRQGVHLAGVVLLFVASAVAWGEVSDGDPRSGAALAGAVLASGAAALAAGGWRTPGVLAASGALGAGVIAGGPSPVVIVVAVLAVLGGDRFGGRRCWRGLVAGLLIATAVAGVAIAAPSDALAAGAAVAVIALPLGFLAVGWFDPRFAVAATVAWLGAMALVAGEWPLAVAVVVAAHVSRAALRRAFAV
jgi:hypothetical protein